ncbi:MAG: PAS domain S-box protein [Pseudomonadota bacterium]
MNFFRKFRNILALFAVLLTLAPLGAVGLLARHALVQRLEADISGKNLLFARALAGNTRTGLSATEGLLAVLTRHPADHQALEGTGILAAAVESDPLLLGVVLADREGRIVAAWPPEAASLSPEAVRCMEEALKDGIRSFSQPFTGPDGELILAAARSGAQGAALGLVSLPLAAGNVFSAPPPAGGRVYLLSAEGRVLAASGAGEGYGAIPPEDVESRRERFLSPGNVEMEIAGRRMLASVAMAPPMGWRVVVVQDQDAALALVREVRRIFFLGGLAGLALALVLALWLSIRLVAPVNHLARQTRKVAGGNYAPFAVGRSYAELDALAEDFSAMTQAIREREHALSQSEERHRAILEGIEDAYYELDPKGHIIDYNQALCDLLGGTRREISGRICFDFIPEKDARGVFILFNQVFNTGRPAMGLTVEILRADGQRRTTEASASLVWKNDQKAGFRGILRDVTARRVMEAELSHTKQFLQNILESSMDTIVSTDMEGLVEYVTPRVRDLLGITEAELLGRKVEHFYARGRKDAVTIMRTLSGKAGFTNHEMQLLHKDGRPRDVSLSVSLLRNEKGEPIGTLGIVRDVTWHKRLEAQLLNAQKMEAVGTLAGGVAHDFNNLLMGIQGYVSLMLLDTPPDHPHHEKLTGIERQVLSASELTRQLLGLARGGKYEVRPENPNELVEGALAVFGPTGKDIRIHRDLAPEIWAVRVDRGQMEQVLLNLFVNAWQAMPKGGDLFVETTNLSLDPESAQAAGAAAGDHVRIRVTDTGKGMDEKTRAKVFDPFFTTKDKGRGTGLGLASVYGIMKNHGGAVTVESEPGQGASFTLYVPAVRQQAQAPAPGKAPETLHRGSGTLLLVDDEPTVLTVGRQMLSALGYRVLTARGGEEALKVFRERAGQVDLVILDMVMPGMGGAETFEALAAEKPDVAVLVSSGYSLEGQAARLLEKGARAFIQKPYTLMSLSRVLRKVLPESKA